MTEKITPAQYRSYLLRLWQEEAEQPWRATLEDPHTGRRLSFASLDELYTFIDRQTETPSSSDTIVF